MALLWNREVDHYVGQELRSFQVAAARRVYKGALAGIDRGYARPLVAGDLFAGVAYEETDNSAGADGALPVRIYTLGDFGLPLPGATAADLGRSVFAAADDVVTFAGVGNSYVGFVQGVPAPGEIILRIETLRLGR